MNKKNIIGGSLLILFAIVIGSTLAWWTWSTSNNEQTNIVVTVGGASISYEDGENINNNNLIPTSTKEKGISKDITISSTGTVYLDLNMNIVSLDDNLKEESFKYEIYKGNDLVRSGNFADKNVGDNISLLNGLKINSTPVTYTLYIWIDGNMSNPNTMYNQNFEFILNANATDENPGLRTLQKLGLEVSTETPDFNYYSPTGEGVFSAEDDYGISYYFRGDVENNYVKFADYYWRIVRINGDGSIRMIYDGTVAHANGESSNDRDIGAYHFNSTAGDAAYVGYMMGIDNECAYNQYCTSVTKTTSYEQATTNTYDSTMKETLDSWYEENIVDKEYNNYIADIIYCNDREINLNYGTSLGYGKNRTGYMGMYRTDHRLPKLSCTNKNDAFTVENEDKGNGDLTYPIGLITADEVVFAGAVSNFKSYLRIGRTFYTMTPYAIDNDPGDIILYTVNINGVMASVYHTGNASLFVRPVISLRSDIELIGSGTLNDPWVVQ